MRNDDRHPTAWVQFFSLQYSPKLIDEKFNQLGSEPWLAGLRASNAVVFDAKFDLTDGDFEPNQDVADLVIDESILERIRNELVDNEADR